MSVAGWVSSQVLVIVNVCISVLKGECVGTVMYKVSREVILCLPLVRKMKDGKIEGLGTSE